MSKSRFIEFPESKRLIIFTERERERERESRRSPVVGRVVRGSAMVLGKLSVPGRPANLDDSRTRAYCAYSRCGLGLFGHFFFSLLKLLPCLV